MNDEQAGVRYRIITAAALFVLALVVQPAAGQAFSHAAGFYSEPFTLILSPTDGTSEIRYTLDGSEPSSDSPLYVEPLRIESRAGEPNGISEIRTTYHVEAWKPPEGSVFKATVVRARTFGADGSTSETVTQTYFVDPAMAARFTLPVVSVATDATGLFDERNGIYVPGRHHQPGNPWSGNYFQRGLDWERPISFELFETDGERVVAINAGMRIHGGFSRAVPYKTLRIYGRSEYDDDNWIEHPIFRDREPKRYKRILLRNAGNDWGGHPWATYNQSQPGTLLRDALMQRLVEHLNIDTQGYRPAIVFINGEYWGIHNFRQRYDRTYFETNYGIEEDELDLLEKNQEVQIGAPDHYEALMRFVTERDMSEDASLRHVGTLMDVDQFIDYFIANIYFDNTDWPQNNIDYWRYRREGFNPGALPGRDGRWRWMLYDTDFGFGLRGDHNQDAGYQRNTLEHAVRPSGAAAWSTFLFRRLLLNPTFQADFLNRFADHLNTIFSGDRVARVIEEMQAAIAAEMPEHLRRWRYPDSVERWQANVDVLRQFARMRPGFAREHLKWYFGLPGTWELTVDVANPATGHIRVNRTRIHPHTPGVAPEPFPWTGTYFQGVPVSVSAVPASGYRFARWEGAPGNSATQRLTVDRASSLTAVFEPADGVEMDPAPHPLLEAPYNFSSWSADQPAGSYPPHMVFQQTSTADPELVTEMESDWTLPYDLQRRSRIIGLGDFGIAFLNTSNPQDVERAGFPGAAVLALNTEGVDSVFVTWKGATPRPGSRVYALRLQYRAGSRFEDVLDESGQPVEYRRNEQEGHEQTLGPHVLPHAASGMPYVQLRWKYYFTGEQLDPESGQRSMLRLSDVHVAPTAGKDEEMPPGDLPELHPSYPNPFRGATGVAFSLPREAQVRIAIYDVLGREVALLVDEVRPAARHVVTWTPERLSAGVYFVRLEALGLIDTGRVVLLP